MLAASKFSKKLGIDKVAITLASKKGIDVLADSNTELAPFGPGEVDKRTTGLYQLAANAKTFMVWVLCYVYSQISII